MKIQNLLRHKSRTAYIPDELFTQGDYYYYTTFFCMAIIIIVIVYVEQTANPLSTNAINSEA